MPTPRLHPSRPQTGPERAKRSREERRAYVAALEALAVDLVALDLRLPYDFCKAHAATIARARASRDATKEED